MVKYAIKYMKVMLDSETCVLIPKKVICGELDESKEYFSDDKQIYSYITNNDLEGRYIIGDAYSLEELRKMFDFPEEYYTNDEIINLFYDDAREKISIIRNGSRESIDLYKLFKSSGDKEIYDIIDGESCAILNKNLFDKLNKIDDLKELKSILKSNSDRLASFDIRRTKNDVKTIFVENGGIKRVDVALNEPYVYTKSSSEVKPEIDSKEFSVKGLYDHLRRNIIGHESELKKISTILFLNYYSNIMYGTESILIAGPTGVGKTQTFKSASNYFNVPYSNINTCNLSVAGYAGTTIEDEFASLIDSCDGDMMACEKAILVFDEFDKLGMDQLDIRQSLSNVFLKVLEGGRFPIVRHNNSNLVYNTTLASKVCLGSFPEAYKKERASIGFGDKIVKEEVFDPNLIVQKGYFSKELLSRIHHFMDYKLLTKDEKRNYIINCDASELFIKKRRFEEQFGIKVVGDEEFADGVINMLKETDESIRDINNIIISSLLNVEFDILADRKAYEGKKLILSADTANNGNYKIE